MINLIRHDLGQSKKEVRFPLKNTCLAIYSIVVNSERSIENVLSKDFPWCLDWEVELRHLFRGYAEAKQRQNVLDYDDLLLYWAEMLRSDDLATDIGDRFDHVLVDEYQDTNRLQSRILLRLKPNGTGLMVVGDDAQSIYSFRAATVRNILDFPEQFTPRAHIVTLEQNYRSSQPILEACNEVIRLAKERFTKDLWSSRQSQQMPYVTTVADEAGQARHVADDILAAREAGVPLKAQAVLVRASHHSARLELELVRRNIPFVKFGGLKFLETAHVKDVIGLLRWCENPRDRAAGFRVLQLLPGIGPVTAERALDAAEGPQGALGALSEIAIPRAAAADWPAFVTLVSRLRKDTPGWPAELDLVRGWYEPILSQAYDDAQVRAADLAQLQQIAAGFPSRERFLTELTLDPPDATSGRARKPVLDEDYLILSTIHSAKGQEWKRVYLLNAVDGCIPSDLAKGPDEFEEERRLLYVAMTRAKDELHLVVPHRFFVHGQGKAGDRHVYASLTRFIPAAIQHRFDRRHWPAPGASANSSSRKLSAKIEVAAGVKRLWG
jgi:DNA helicase-2/ATP-dependent DNA helicase PcrA